MTRIKKGKQSGTKWDRVKLENGMVGYVAQSYLEIVKQEINITTSNGILTGILEETTVKQIVGKMDTSYTIQILDGNQNILTSNDYVGTGCIVKLLNGKTLVEQYQVVLYGDVNGDAKINSVDLLVLQRHILELKKLDNIYLKAGNIDKTGKEPTSVDLLKIQRHILGLSKIEQTITQQISDNKKQSEYTAERTSTDNMNIDNSKQLNEVEEENLKEETQNTMFIIIGIVVVICVLGTVGIVIYYKKFKNK